jgi:hypothetical protein
MCKGSNEWVHLACLRKWQKEVVLSSPTHPKYHTHIDRVCNICLEPFAGVGIPPSRHERMVQYTGAELAALVRPGNLLVSSREGSRENLELVAAHPEIARRLLTWTKAVFLMLSTGRDGGGGGGGLMAVSMSRPCPAGPPRDVPLSASERRRWAERGAAGVAAAAAAAAAGSAGAAGAGPCRVKHFDGGPMQREDPIAVAHVPDAAAWARKGGGGCRAIPPNWVFGRFEAVERLVARANAEGGAGVGAIHVVWGCGGWGTTQVLAEIARGGWGLVAADAYLAIRPDAAMGMDFALDFEWTRIMPLATLAPRSEYSRRRGQ